MKKSAIISFTIFITVVLIGCGTYYIMTKMNISKQVSTPPEPPKDAQTATIYKSIHKKHELLNKLICYDQYKNWTPSSSLWTEHDATLKQIEEQFLQYTPSVEGDLQKDFQNIVSYTKQARKEKKATTLVEIHRVMHDLDILLNGYQEKLWNVTVYKRN
ncbi:hypothetical protein [Bacillus sp. S14(2024)]|uniref:hypothetical protein n=1 Tax=Bacillus sp. S14(2024) TaxID=3162884 RepID=UPI003D2423CA